MYLKLLQTTCNERLTRCLLPAESEHILHGLLKGLPLSNQMSRLHHDEEQVVHLKAKTQMFDIQTDILNKYTHLKL